MQKLPAHSWATEKPPPLFFAIASSSK
jgi:hypothetical protein